jgi:hypothetical protein
MDTITPPPDPVELVRQLDPVVIHERILALDAERQALLVLLRAAQRGPRSRRPARPRPQEASDA